MRHGAARVASESLRGVYYLRPFSAIGDPMPLHVAAAGTVPLAWLSCPERDALLAQSGGACAWPRDGLYAPRRARIQELFPEQ